MKLNVPPDPLIEQALDKFAAEQGLSANAASVSRTVSNEQEVGGQPSPLDGPQFELRTLHYDADGSGGFRGGHRTARW